MQIKEGVVTSTKMDKTVVVTVHQYRTHPKYKKRYRVSKKFLAHDEQNACKEGDTVTIVSTIPLSKRKRWRVIDAAELAQVTKAALERRSKKVAAADETFLIVDFEPRKRAKTRGTRMHEKSSEGAEPAPAPAPSAAPAPEVKEEAPAAEAPAPEVKEEAPAEEAKPE